MKKIWLGQLCLVIDRGIKEGDVVKRTGNVVSVPVGDALIGRVVNALGQPIDGKGPINTNKTRPVESEATGIMAKKICSSTTRNRNKSYRCHDTNR